MAQQHQQQLLPGCCGISAKPGCLSWSPSVYEHIGRGVSGQASASEAAFLLELTGDMNSVRYFDDFAG